jgi:hypothetical protein
MSDEIGYRDVKPYLKSVGKINGEEVFVNILELDCEDEMEE